MRICRNAPSICHLLFADDSLILIQAKGEDAMPLWNSLELYEQCSGQMINKTKSAILYSPNTSDPDSSGGDHE